MDYLHIALTIFTFLSVSLCIYVLLRTKYLGKYFIYLSDENRCLKSGLHRRVQESLEEIENRMDDLYKEIKSLDYQLRQLHQDKISWITSSKELPQSSKMVLVLDKDKKESQGFLHKDKEGWTLSSLGEGMKKVSFDKITHWKPLFHL